MKHFNEIGMRLKFQNSGRNYEANKNSMITVKISKLLRLKINVNYDDIY